MDDEAAVSERAPRPFIPEEGTLRATMSVPPAAPRKSRRALKLVGWLAVIGAVAMGAIALSSRGLQGLGLPSSWLADRLHGAGPFATPEFDVGRADAELVRKGRTQIGAGFLTIPPSFASEDGAYDLVVFLHGNTDLVEESFAVSKINAVVSILNMGISSGPYEERFANSVAMPELEERVHSTMEKRGLHDAHERRLALVAWSAGYGGVMRSLEQPVADHVDAVVLLDGIHVPYMNKNRGELALDRLAALSAFAAKAVRGERLMSITHSEIAPYDYAGTRETTDALLKGLGLERGAPGAAPEWPWNMASAKRAVMADKMRPLVPKSEVHVGSFHVRGYGGDQKEDHMSHLIQMAYTALPDLAARWAKLPQ